MPVGPEIIGRLIDRHARALVLYARQLCDDPEDVVQQALMILAEQRETPREPIAWLYRVVRNEALMASRAAQRRRRREQRARGSRWRTEKRANERVTTVATATATAMATVTSTAEGMAITAVAKTRTTTTRTAAADATHLRLRTVMPTTSTRMATTAHTGGT